MPNYKRKADSNDDLEIAARILETVHRQVASYMSSLDKLRLMRKEIDVDPELAKQIRAGPAEMTKILVERGIPENLAAGMAGEDFRDEIFSRKLGFWTWDCCCTACCITCVFTNDTVVISQ